MFGLLVLLFLGVWIAITLFAIKFGAKHSGKKGALLGFMLTMGGIVGYWVIEYIHIQRTVTKLCETEGGIKVYVTLEEWRQQIGEEEWRKLIPHEKSVRQDFDRHYKWFGDSRYFSTLKYNERIIVYSGGQDVNEFIRKSNNIVLDVIDNKILIESTFFSASAGYWASGGSYKEWINNVESCRDTIDDNFYKLLENYSNNLIKLTGNNK